MPALTVEILVNGARGSRRRGASSCKGCGLKLFWAATPAGKALCFEVPPEVIELRGDIEVVSNRDVHWPKCPKRDAFRRPKPAPQGLF